MSSTRKPRDAKRAYAKPSLAVYGSVRELTGTNSGLQSGDAGTMMP
jgi:hypothetical protein